MGLFLPPYKNLYIFAQKRSQREFRKIGLTWPGVNWLAAWVVRPCGERTLHQPLQSVRSCRPVPLPPTSPSVKCLRSFGCFSGPFRCLFHPPQSQTNFSGSFRASFSSFSCVPWERAFPAFSLLFHPTRWGCTPTVGVREKLLAPSLPQKLGKRRFPVP